MSPHHTAARAAALMVVVGLAVATPSVAATGTAAATATSGATGPVSFNLQTGTKVTSGRAHALGKISFPTTTSVKVRGKFDDRCSASGKGDGYAAYFQISLELSDGSTVKFLGRDERGCTRAPLRVVVDRDVRRPIVRAALLVIESTPQGGAYSYEDIAETKGRVIER